MSCWFCACPRSFAWFVACTLALATVAPAAPKPLPDLTPDERQMRALVQPLRDGVSKGADLQPLHDWLSTRKAAGKGREAERELRRVLQRINDDYEKDLLHAAEWAQTLQLQRAKLYNDLAEEKISLRRALERTTELSPVPTEDELWPGRAGFSDGFIAGDAGAVLQAGSGSEDSSDETAPNTESAESTDLDAPRILDRLTLDLTALRHLLHECDDEYEREKERHRTAMENLATFLRDHRAASSGPR